MRAAVGVRGSARQAQIGSARPLQLDRADVLDLDPPEREPVCGRTDQQLARLGGLLQPRGDVDGLAGGEGRVAVVRDDLARLDPDPRLELELVHAVQDGQRGADRALGVVLVRLRDPEGRHDGVAGELLDDAAVRGDAVRDVLEELSGRAGARPRDRSR